MCTCGYGTVYDIVYMLTCVYNMFVGICIYVLTVERERESEGGGPGDQDVMS